MKKGLIKKAVLLAIPLTFMLSTTALAFEEVKGTPPMNHSCETKNPKKQINKENKGKHYTRSATLILMNKYGVKPDEITKAKESGKTVFDLAKIKGVEEQQLRDLILAPRLKTIDEMVLTGELTKEEGEMVKSKMKQHISNWDGKLNNYNPEKDKFKIKEKNTGLN